MATTISRPSAVYVFWLALLYAGALQAQPELAGAPRLQLALDRLNTLGRVLMIAAHPDDENTEVLAYFARARGYRAGYLSLTRGEGGQNLLGPEQGAALGVIRTHELLAARRIDGGEQFFTRAIDFGYTKTPEEAFARWGREAILSDVVWVIRRFRPDVIVLVFSGTPADGHGHHQASHLLAREAFAAAADAARFPEQLAHTRPWKAKRMVRVLPNWRPEHREAIRKMKERIDVDSGAYDPLLGYSYAEIAAISHSAHSSQAFGLPQAKGRQELSFAHLDGERATRDLFEDIDTTWKRVPGAERVSKLLAGAAAAFEPRRPEGIAGTLLDARDALAGLSHPDAADQRAELDEAIALACGLWLDASSETARVSPGVALKVTATALSRSRAAMRLLSARLTGQPPDMRPDALRYNEPVTRTLAMAALPEDAPPTQPYWLREARSGDVYSQPGPEVRGLPVAPAPYEVAFEVEIESRRLTFVRPVQYRWVDLARGELVRPLEVVPPVTLHLPAAPAVFPDGKPRPIAVALAAHGVKREGTLRLDLPAGWRAEPASHQYQAPAGETRVFSFRAIPSPEARSGAARAVAVTGGREIASSELPLDYAHIPRQSIFRPASLPLVRASIVCTARRVGYIVGAGDEVPESLRQLGLTVTALTRETLPGADLASFDAIVLGVRAQSTRSDIAANRARLLEYVESGGTLVVQYSRLETGFGAGDTVAPYPITIGSKRISVEDAPVTITAPSHPLLTGPNRITAADFEGWVQERGLYFPSTWDPRYQVLLSSSDPGEEPLPGGVLYARYGKGVYIFTSYAWFRQLPAGVPGAYRIFANLLSAGHAATR
ncbi:MAG TPA: hypothetical protein DEH78_00740 [Solibacterales bacterium]|nr:hypothetical protein [Bryobacterales bacterium]